MRQVVLDTETTGLDPKADHIIEIGAVELVDRKIGRKFHTLVKAPVRVHPDAAAVHGITDEMLECQPIFEAVSKEFLDFCYASDEVQIHNAPFDVQFLDKGFEQRPGWFRSVFRVVDTLKMAREKHAGRRNSLDVLVERYGIPNTREGVHGALLDAELLAEVYLRMTAGQGALDLMGNREAPRPAGPLALPTMREVKVFLASEAEQKAHADFCKANGITVF